MKSREHLAIAVLSTALLYSAHSEDQPITGSIQTPSSVIQLDKGLPATAKESQALFDELDYQRSCQTYLWALPIVSLAEWQAQHEKVFD